MQLMIIALFAALRFPDKLSWQIIGGPLGPDLEGESVNAKSIRILPPSTGECNH